ncbi:MAG TPA: NAD-dependent epimerase/dehydratase family protein, partial [Deltaproteobacteria bacterium]|nr:NAD-dependent epimerase/dehydratase family protein [Deltaproteobacteria bacterium]
ERLAAETCVESITGVDIRRPGFSSPRLEFLARDVRDPLDPVFEGRNIDTVVHAAYILPPIHDTALMEDINVNGTKNVFQTAVRHNVEQVVECSSATAYGFHPDNPPVLTEESPLKGNEDFTYAKNKREIEEWLEGFSAEHPETLFTVIRPCFVVGPGFANPLARHLCRKICMLPDKTAPFQFIHEDDLVEIIFLLAKNRKGGVYNLAADGTMTFDEMLAMLGSIPLRLPLWLLGPLNEIAWKLRMRFLTEFPSSSLKLTIYPWIVSNEKVKRELGYAFRYTTREAFEDFVRSVKGR